MANLIIHVEEEEEIGSSAPTRIYTRDARCTYSSLNGNVDSHVYGKWTAPLPVTNTSYCMFLDISNRYE